MGRERLDRRKGRGGGREREGLTCDNIMPGIFDNNT